MKYKLEDITIRIVDVAANARRLYGDMAEDIAGGPLAEHDYRFEVTANNGVRGTSTTFARGTSFSADYVLRYLNG